MDGPRGLHLHLHLDKGSTWKPRNPLLWWVALSSQSCGWLPVRSWELRCWKDPGSWFEQCPVLDRDREGEAGGRAATIHGGD